MTPTQTSLFDLLPPQADPEEEEGAPPWMRLLCHDLVEVLRESDDFPWPTPVMRTYSIFMPRYAAKLPPEEGEPLLAEFREHYKRLGWTEPF